MISIVNKLLTTITLFMIFTTQGKSSSGLRNLSDTKAIIKCECKKSNLTVTFRYGTNIDFTFSTISNCNCIFDHLECEVCTNEKEIQENIRLCK